MKMPVTILFAGGGTGGHLFPGIAVAEVLQSRFPTIHLIFVGSPRSIELTIAAENNIEHRMLPVESLSTLKRNPFRFVWRNWQACRTSKKWMKELRPAAVIGLGGYASAPLVYAASWKQVPIILLEQNVIPGRTTRSLSRFAANVCISFAEATKFLPRARRISVTGNPVRAEIARLSNRPKSVIQTQKSSEHLAEELLILGGSQGADSLNTAVLKAIAMRRGLLKNWKITHQTGPRDVETARQCYEQLGLKSDVAPFFHEMSELYDRASLVISRSGATTLAELACAGKAMILLPYPHAADSHQHANANVFVERQAAILVEHAQTPDETATTLARELGRLLSDSEQRKRMGSAAYTLAHPLAAERIADVIESEVRKLAVSFVKQHDPGGRSSR